MTVNDITRLVLSNLGHVPTEEQRHATETFAAFISDPRPEVAMVLRGSAGTGKTTLAAAIVASLNMLRHKMMLLAPTGRAAKVLSLYAAHPAFTIHRRIYRQKAAGGMAAFNLNDNLHTDTLFIVDEASMIANGGDGSSAFGSGMLLDDLIRYVYQGHGCRLLLVGDTAQLPPVGEEQSPALMTACLQGYGLQTYEADLCEVLRQAQASGILYNATVIRESIDYDNLTQLPVIRLKGFADVKVVPGDELIEQLASSYSHAGTDDTIVITRSNKRANIYNQGIRRTVFDQEEALCRGDRLMIVKNNYFWGVGANAPERLNVRIPTLGGAGSYSDFLANGDSCVVQRVRNHRELYGFHFADVTITMPDYDDHELTCTVLLDTLTTEAPALTREQQEILYNNVMEDYADIPLKADRLARLRQDPYYNALQVKFGYAVTCHKAQGGQWAHVYIDQGYMTDDMLTPEYLHWLYTAFTRATEKIFLVNWPATQTENDEKDMK